MPTSLPNQINEILTLILGVAPESVLDIGVGFGKYGFLAREYLEMEHGQGTYGKWTKRIEGIEAFEEYITPLHREIYDEIHIGPAQDILPKLPKDFDLILLIDVIEHFEKEEGMDFLQLALKKGRNLIISTPKKPTPQGSVYDNPFEEHKSVWHLRDFQQLGKVITLPHRHAWICYLGDQHPRVLKKVRRYSLPLRFQYLLQKVFRK